jgi:acyl-CoA dehydrogenase
MCLLREELASVSPLADTLTVMQGLGSNAVARFGAAALKQELLPQFIEGSACAAFAMTEKGAGSDVAAINTGATRRPGGYVVSGEKTLISNAGIATHYTVVARTGEGREGLSVFLIPATARGLTVTPLEMLAPHPIGELRLEHVEVPETHRLGREGQGFGIALTTLDVFRPTVGAAACGLARRAFDEGPRAHATAQAVRPGDRRLPGDAHDDRRHGDRAFGRAYARVSSGRRRRPARPRYQALVDGQALRDRGGAAHRRSLRAAARGRGLVKGHIAERLYREVRALRIYEGTSEIQRLIIADRTLHEEATTHGVV